MNRVFGLLLLLLVSTGVFAQNNTWYAITSGEWSNAEIWTLDPAAAIKVNPNGKSPEESDNVVIKSGRTIIMDADGYKANVLTVDGRLALKETSGHQFSQIRGSGRIIMEADNFPSGDATHFISKNQGEGTVVFKGSSFTFSSGNTFYSLDIEMEAAQVLSLGADVVLNGNLTVRSGNLQFGNNTTSRNLVVKGDISVLSGASINVSEINATHQIEIFGNITNNGLIKLTNLDQPTYNSSSTNGSVTLKASGASNSTLSANNKTFLQRLVVEKGTDRTYRFTVNSSNKDNFRLFGRNNNSVAEKALYINKGTLELTGDLYIHSLTEGGQDFTIPVDGGLWINGENVEVHTTAVSNDASGFTSVGVAAAANGNKSFSVKGLFKITDGELNTHTHGFVAWNDGNALVEIAGGKIYSPGFRSAGTQDGKWTYYQSGGEVYLYGDLGSDLSGSGAATFSVKGEDNVFIMSDGLLEIQDAATSSNLAIGIESGEGKYNVTGGTIRVNQAAGASSIFNVSTTAPLYNLEIEAGNVQLQSELTVVDDLTIEANSSLVGGIFNLGVGRELIVFGDMETATLFMNGSSVGKLTNNTGNSLELNNLVIDKSDETASVLLNAEEFGIAGNLTVKRGNFNLNDKEVTVNGNITLNKGNIVTDDITSGKLVLSGGGPHLLSSASEDYSMGHVELNDGSGANLSSHVFFSHFTLTNGILDIGKYRMTVDEPIAGSGFDNSKMIKTGGVASDKGLNYNFSLGRGGSVLYPVGVDDDGDKYTPAIFEINNARNISGSFAVVPVVGRHPAAKDEEFVGFEYLPLEFYWRTYKESFSGIENDDVDLSYRYHTDQSFGRWDVMRFLNFQKYLGEWEDEGGQRRDLNDITFDNVGEKIEGDFTVAEVGSWTGNSPFDDVHTYYSRKDGNWNDRTTWSFDGHSGEALSNGGWFTNPDPLPGQEDIVIIGSGHNVHIQDNNRSAAQIEIKANGTLDIRSTSGHNFIDIKGNGTFRTSTGNIPDADYGDFVTSETAVFEYYGEGNIDISDVLDEYPTLRISGRDTKRAVERDLKINGDLIITNENTTFSLSTKDDGDIDVAGDVIVEGNGKLRFPSNVMRTFNIEGDLFIRNNAQLFINDGGDEDIVHEINLYGNLFQSGGKLDLSETAKGKLSFLGDESVDVETRGDINSEFYQLEVAKSALDKMVKFTGDFSLTGAANGNEKPLQLTNGTVWLANSGIDINLTTGGKDFEIPSEASVIVDEEATVRASGNNTGIWLDGLLKIDNGAKVLLNGGSNNYIEYAASGNAQIWVGNTNNITPATQLNVGAQIRRSVNTDAGVLSFVQDKAATNIVVGSKEATVANRGVFEILNEGSIFEQNEDGSVVTIGRGQTNASVPALIFNPAIYNGAEESGFVIGDNNTPAGSAVGLLLSKPLNYLRIALPVNAFSQLQTVPANIRGHLVVESGTFDANGLDVNLYGHLTNSGTFEPSYNTTYFKGDALQTITGDVSFHKIIKEGTGTLTQAEDTEVTINDDLNILSGVVNTADNQLIVKGNLLIENGASTQSSSATDGVVMAGSNSQLLQVEGEIGRLSVNNTAGVVVPTQGGAINFAGQLKLDAGVLDIGRNLLVIGKDAEIVSGTAGFSEDAMIQTNLSFTDAGVQKFLPAITSLTAYTIPIGSMGKYTPVGLNVSTTGNATGSIRVKAANEPHITIPASEKNRVLHYNWTLDAEGIENFSANVTMQAFADAVEGDGSAYITARLLDASEGYWNKYNFDGFDENNYVLNFTFSGTDDAGIDGDFTAGEEDAIPEKVQAFVTRSNGLWNDASTWSVEGSGVVPSGGPRGAIVKVNHKVTVPESNFSAVAYMTDLGNNGTLDFGSTFGHRLGKVKGTGRIILQRNALPAGMYDEFFSQNGGTLEFTGDTDYDVLGEITLVNNLALTGSGERRLGAADLTLNGGLTVDTVSLINESEINLSLKGNLTFNNGSFDIRNGLVTFDGSQQQNVGGLSAFSGSNALTSAIVKNGKGLSLSNDLEVTKTMSVNGGNIVSTNSSALIISNPSLIALQLNDPASFIGTTLRKRLTANDSYDFRVGKDDRPATLNLSSLDASGLWEVEYYNSNPASSSPAMNPESMVASDLKFVSHNEYWRVKAPATANAGVTVRWDEQSGFSTESIETQKLRMVEWTSANAWSIVNGDVYHNEGNSFGAIESNNAVGFNKISGKGNFFTIGSIEKYLYDWTGNLDSDWFNPGNWDDGKVPTSNTEVTIGVVSSLPEIGLNSEKDAYALDLTINPSASVTLRPGATLNVSGSFENNGDVVLKSNPNAVAALNVPVDNADSGHGIVELSGLKANQWYRFGQPIAFATGAIYKASGDKSWVYRSTTNWERIQSDTEIIHPMEGIMVLYDQDETLTYGGQLNTGEINWEVPYGRGYYLFSNPYPGSMRWDISNPNTGITVSDNVSSTIYYRVYAGSVEDDYMITYNGFSGFSTLVDGESMPGGYTTSNIGNISPMQSVWVKVNDSDKASIKVDNRARVSDNSLPLKSAGNNSDRDVIRIVQSNDYISDVAVVYFDDYFQEGMDRSDSEKMMNSSKYIPEIFTRVENRNLAINGLPSLEADQLSIPLSVRIREKGEVAISMVLDDFTENYEVWLEDLELEIQTNMREVEQYTYEWNNSGYNHNRFVMHLIKKVEIPTNIAEPDAPKAGEILISGYDDFVLVKISPDLLANGNAELTLMDLSGRQLSSTQTAANETEIQLPEATGVYLIKVTAGTQQKTEKVISNNQ